MGLKQRNNELKYIRISDGKFYLSTDKEKTDPYDELEGIITDIGIKFDEWEGKKIKKMYINLQDDAGDAYSLSVHFDSSYTSTFVSFAKSVDLTRPVTLVPVMKVDKKTGKDKRSLLVSQSGQFARSFYTKDHPNGLPLFKKLTVNGQEVWDKTDFLAFLENVITTEFKPKVNNVARPSASLTQQAMETAPVSVDDDDVADDLPF